MRLVTNRINVEVKYRKISVEQVIPQPEVIRRSITSGKQVFAKRVSADSGEIMEKFRWIDFDEDGKQVAKTDICYCIEEKAVSPYSRTSEIKVVKEITASVIDDFLYEGYYEIFSVKDEIINDLYREAERYIKNDLIGVALFSWGNGFKQYYALLSPILREGKFVWIMKLTRTRLVYSHLMDASEAKAIKKPPTPVTLPPIEAILT